MKAKMRMIIAVCVLSLVSCSFPKEIPFLTTVTEENEKEETKETSDISEVGEAYTAILHIDDEIYYEISLKKGEKIPILSREGYQFEGYVTDTDVSYIKADGTVSRTYRGAEQLELYPKFLPLGYTITFLYNGKEVGIPKQICNYDQNLIEYLPFGEALGEECIIGFQDKDKRLLIDKSQETFYLKDMEQVLDTEKREVALELIKTMASFQDSRLDTYEVSDGGFFQQKLHVKGNAYDRFFMEGVDIEALKQVGYQNAEVEISCLIQEVDAGEQYIRLYAQAEPEDKGDYIMESGKIEDMLQEEEKLYTMKAVVPIERLESRELYVYYNAGGFGKDNWISRGMTISVQFRK